MMNKENIRVLFLITARGGSKGVPKKNIRQVGGLPLIAYKIISAQKTNLQKRIICSTDDEEIVDVAIQYGAEVPFIRPSSLAADNSSSIEVIVHAMEWIGDNDKRKYNILILLEPSSPFATYIDFENAIELWCAKNAIGILGVRKVDPNTCFIAELSTDGLMSKHFEKIKSITNMRRQDFDSEYTMNGALYLVDWDYFKTNRTFHSNRTYAYIMSEEYSLEIDNPKDLKYAQFLIDQGYIDLSFWR